MKRPLLVPKASNEVMALLMAFGIVLLFVNVLLVQQNKKLKVLASRPDRALEIKAGTMLPPLEGIDNYGRRQRIGYGQDPRKTVLLVLSSRCHVCEENMPNLKELINRLDQRLFRLAAVLLQSDGIKQYASQHGIDQIPILAEVDPKYRVAYSLALTPQIILIDPDGKAEKVWTGLLQSEDKQEIQRMLDVRIP